MPIRQSIARTLAAALVVAGCPILALPASAEGPPSATVASPVPAAASRKGSEEIRNAWDLPPLVLPDLQDQSRNLYDWHGKVILLNFWATWCPPCQYEIPRFIRYQEEYAERGLQVVGVALDEIYPLRNFVRTTGINYPILRGHPRKDRRLLRVWGDDLGILPYTVVIDRDGRLHYTHMGVFEDETFEDSVLPLLDAGPNPNTAAEESAGHSG